MNAILNQRVGAANIIGISNTSGGIGKMELSKNEMPAKAHMAYGLPDIFMMLS